MKIIDLSKTAQSKKCFGQDCYGLGCCSERVLFQELIENKVKEVKKNKK